MACHTLISQSSLQQWIKDMRSDTCMVASCAKEPVVHVQRAWDRRILQEASCCGDHIKGFLDRYYESQMVGDGTPRSWGEAVVFDIELVLYDERLNNPCQFSLREVGGRRRLDCRIGPFEAAALQRELEQFVAPRPLTHRAMASLIAALGGRLECVVVDKFVPAQRMYEAKLHIQQMNDAIVVDVRISDAVILAVVCEVPIVVSSDVLAALAET